MNNPAGKLLIDEISKRLEEKEEEIDQLRDFIRDLEHTNTKLMESEKVKSDFLSNLKNEINNPMASLIALSEELNSVGDELERKRVSGMIHYETLSLDFQLRNIFGAAELESGESSSSLHKTNIDTASLIADCLNSFEPMIKEKSINVVNQYDNKVCINTDADKLHLVMLNLISNAIVFNRDGGKVTISINLIGNVLLFSITDEGIGIDPVYHQSIFDRFRELNSGSTKKFRGHGLGLSVAKSMAEQLDGTISVDSTPGMGSTFTFSMPAELEVDACEGNLAGVEYFVDQAAVKEY